jgi:hypothetical protein
MKKLKEFIRRLFPRTTPYDPRHRDLEEDREPDKLDDDIEISPGWYRDAV